jgi:hypothetical protein
MKNLQLSRHDRRRVAPGFAVSGIPHELGKDKHGWHVWPSRGHKHWAGPFATPGEAIRRSRHIARNLESLRGIRDEYAAADSGAMGKRARKSIQALSKAVKSSRSASGVGQFGDWVYRFYKKNLHVVQYVGDYAAVVPHDRVGSRRFRAMVYYPHDSSYDVSDRSFRSAKSAAAHADELGAEARMAHERF